MCCNKIEDILQNVFLIKIHFCHFICPNCLLKYIEYQNQQIIEEISHFNNDEIYPQRQIKCPNRNCHYYVSVSELIKALKIKGLMKTFVEKQKLLLNQEQINL